MRRCTAPRLRVNRRRAAFVLVHGAWHGGWCWRRVADRLERSGHKVYAPSLTGLGDRSHLITNRVNVSTHIADIANLIRFEDLSEIVLVGHSYAGLVISGVAERALEQIRSIVFLDAYVPQNGQSVYQPDVGTAASNGECGDQARRYRHAAGQRGLFQRQRKGPRLRRFANARRSRSAPMASR